MTVPTIPTLAIQRALYGRLAADQALMAQATGGVHDGAPEGTPYPYVVLGEAIETPWNTHAGYGRETVHTLHVWDQYRGFTRALGIAARLVELLDHQPLTIVGHHHVSTVYEFLQTLTDPEPPGDIRHVPVRFRVRTEQPRA